MSEVLISGQRWVDNQKTVRELSDNDREKLLTQPPVTRLLGREIEKWSCQEQGTRCRGGQSLIVPGPFPTVPGPAPQPGAGSGASLVTHAFSLVGSLSRGDKEVVSTHRGTYSRCVNQPNPLNPAAWFPGPGNAGPEPRQTVVGFLEARATPCLPGRPIFVSSDTFLLRDLKV